MTKSVWKLATCEWHPKLKRAAYIEEKGACSNEAVICVGADGDWHLCESCAADKYFNKFKVRKQLKVRS